MITKLQSGIVFTTSLLLSILTSIIAVYVNYSMSIIDNSELKENYIVQNTIVSVYVFFLSFTSILLTVSFVFGLGFFVLHFDDEMQEIGPDYYYEDINMEGG